MNDWVIGIDLGGTKIEIGLVSPQDQIIGRRKIPTQASEGPARVIERIAECVEELAKLLPLSEHIAAAGICSPGPVDHENGMIIDPPNLAGLHNTPLRQLLSERLNLPVCLEHDAKAAALGEFYFGAGRGERNMVYIVVGTGVGGAIISDGQLLRGSDNTTGEIGHVMLDRNGEVCNCGSRGCVETFLAGPWLAWHYQRLLEQGDSQSRSVESGSITGEQVVSLAAQGDLLASQVVTQAGEALGTATATLAMILNIDLFVIGGSVAKAGDLLLEPARQALPHHCYRSVGCEIRIVPTELGDEGPILGSAWLARQILGENRSTTHSITTTGIAEPERAELEAVTGFVFDVQRFSLHDGAGVRTNVFLKGCALHCPWCANPESQHLYPDMMLSTQRCITCGLFPEPCTVGWTQNRAGLRERYAERVSSCPTSALRWGGVRRTAGDIIAEVKRDKPFYENGGGLTLTGGEPTFQPRLAEALLRLAKANEISTAIETSGHTRWKIFERLLPYLDEILFDVKHMNGVIHKATVGVDNSLILSNLHKLAALRAPVKIRVPLIPGFNATSESLEEIAGFVANLDGLEKAVCLLPYHTFGRAKYKALNRDYPWEGHERLTDSEVQIFRDIFVAHGLTVSIGG